MARRSRKDWRPPSDIKVIFRTYLDGEVIALFPEVAGSPRESECLLYTRIGQHGAANCGGVIHGTRPATLDEYAPLYDELEQIGYNLEIRHRISPQMEKNRVAEVRGMRR